MRSELAPEIQAILHDQEHLHGLVGRLDARIDQFIQRTEKAPPAPVPPITPPPVPAPVTSKPAGPRLSDDDLYVPFNKVFPPPAPPSERPPAPAQSEPRASNPKAVEPSRAPHPQVERDMVIEDSLEMKLGRIWLVRLGLVILLTGLVFLGSLAYQHVVPRLGAGGKLTLIGLAGIIMGGIGWRLERKRASLRSYARALIGGAAATLYYTAYAAHYAPALRVITSPLAGGLLLLGMAGVIGWLAHRRRSETLATLAILLSYYTSGINEIGLFTLYSSLLLTATGVFFLLRHRWTRLSLVSLFGTYLSFAWWRFFGEAPAGAESTMMMLGFLSGYWTLFTAAVLLAKQREFAEGMRTGFATANNSAFLALGAHAIVAGGSGLFWLFALSMGGVFLVLARLAAWRDPEDRTLDGAYLVQGLAAIALGLVAKLTGYQLALAFALQSVVLLTRGGRHASLREGAAWLSIAAAVLLSQVALQSASPHAVGTGAAVVVCAIFDAWWHKKQRNLLAISPEAGILTAAAFALGSSTLWHHLGGLPSAPWLAVAALGLGMVPLVRRLPELAVISQALLPLAAGLWVASGVQGMWPPAVIFGSAIALAQWWLRQKQWEVSPELRLVLEGAAAVSSVIVALPWLIRSAPNSALMAWAAVAGVAWMGGALWTRSRSLAAVAPIFLLLAVIHFWINRTVAHWAVALVPSAGLAALGLLMKWRGRLGPDMNSFGVVLRDSSSRMALVLLLPWSFLHIPAPWLPLFFASVGAGCALASGRLPALAYGSLVMGTLAGFLMAVHGEHFTGWQNLTAIILFASASRVARKWNPGGPLQDAASTVSTVTIAGISLWVIRFSAAQGWELGLTVQTALLALLWFGTGLLLKDRIYRFGGLGLLAVGIAHVFFVDVWKLNLVYRIVSFITLGLVLMVVGYFYNRFAETIRKWL